MSWRTHARQLMTARSQCSAPISRVIHFGVVGLGVRSAVWSGGWRRLLLGWVEVVPSVSSQEAASGPRSAGACLEKPGGCLRRAVGGRCRAKQLGPDRGAAHLWRRASEAARCQRCRRCELAGDVGRYRPSGLRAVTDDANTEGRRSVLPLRLPRAVKRRRRRSSSIAPRDERGVSMLVLSRKLGERILIGEDIEVAVVAVDGSRARIGVVAPRDVAVLRSELLASTDDWEPAAAER
jgi:carbon storage regulator